MKNEKDVIAILFADAHLSLTPPVWRSNEPNWFEAQARPLLEIKQLQEKYKCLIICAGDIFDKWDSKPELINFAIRFLPDEMYSIPGQHDLPLHNIKDIEKSAFWTLVEAAKIKQYIHVFEGGAHIETNTCIFHCFPFGNKLKAIDFNIRTDRPDKLHIAIIHQYIWTDKFGFPEAPVENKLNWKAEYAGYDALVFGDNHKGFVTKIKNTPVFNCGTLMRRKSDEKDYKPQVGLLLKSGEIEPYYLDISKDKFIKENYTAAGTAINMTDLIRELEKLGDTGLDFESAIEHYFEKNQTDKQIQKIILEAMKI